MLFNIMFDRTLVRFGDPDYLCGIMHQGQHLFKGSLVDLLGPYFYFGAHKMFKPNEYIWKWIMRKFTLLQMVHKLLGFKKYGTHIL